MSAPTPHLIPPPPPPPSRPNPLADFTHLSPTAFLYTPPPSQNIITGASAPPDLILLATWYAAAPHHVAKYAAQYRVLYPTTPQLVLTSTLADTTWRTRRAQEQRLGDVVRVARALIAQGEAKGGVVVHGFSNGGALTACAFARAWRGVVMAEEAAQADKKGRMGGWVRRKEDASNAMPLRALLLDSTPSRPSVRRGAAAIAAPFHGLGRALLLAVTYPLLILLYLLAFLPGVSDPVTRVRRELLDERLFARGAPRCYFFSEEDEMVGWQDVVAHAGQARAKGIGRVREVRFVGSGHVRHAAVSGERYWGEVSGVVDALEE